jgi:hypothetical protein
LGLGNGCQEFNEGPKQTGIAFEYPKEKLTQFVGEKIIICQESLDPRCSVTWQIMRRVI